MSKKINTNRFMRLHCLVLIISMILPCLAYANKTAPATTKQEDTQQQLNALATHANQTLQQIEQLHRTTQTMMTQQAQQDTLVISFRILLGFTLILLLTTLYILTQKYAPLLEMHKALIEKLSNRQAKHKDDIQALQKQLQQTIEDTKKHTATLKTTRQLQQQLQTLQDAQQLTKDQVAIAQDILQKHLKVPLEQGIPEFDVTTLKSLLNTGHLNFQDALKTKALIAEHQQQWQHVLQLWNTLLLETEANNEALLHMGYAHYKQAADNSKNAQHLDKAIAIYDRIMLSAPEYFEDAYGYDDQTVGPDAINTNAEELWIYQQLEELIIKTDELRNYQSILNIACQYAVAGEIEDARDCLEQVSSIYHAASCKQLQQDTDLDTLRTFDWFQAIIDEACIVNQLQRAKTEQGFQTNTVSKLTL